ncbi:competence type IV pilus minor pilin ComGD [Lysinibacillus sp. LZ02]|uniref:competence type IV pilus minor pilin ComGD n=1 Tax=Lysinibacillus sp. LZ02 TaxID=3420668 RepID=UPI003D36914E
MIRQQYGFTLIETLIVLMIFSLLTTVVISFSYHHLKINQYEQAIERFRLTLHLAQLTAQQQKKEVSIYAMNHKEVGSNMSHQDYRLNWVTPEGMTIHIHTNNRQIKFNVKGHVHELGKVEFKTPQKSTTYSINLSKGRLRLIE